MYQQLYLSVQKSCKRFSREKKLYQPLNLGFDLGLLKYIGLKKTFLQICLYFQNQAFNLKVKIHNLLFERQSLCVNKLFLPFYSGATSGTTC